MNDPGDADIRRGTPIIRRFIVEKELANAWRTLGREKEPTIIAPNLSSLIGDLSFDQFVMASAGGAKYNGLEMLGMSTIKGNAPPPIKDSYEVFKSYIFSLSQYLESICIIVEGKPVKRRELVKYMAYARGGVHLSPGGRTRNKEVKLFKLMEKREQLSNMNGTNWFFFELLSTGQSIVKPPDIRDIALSIKELHQRYNS